MLSIGEFSKLSSVTRKTLRYYDEINILKPSYVDPINNYRYYEIKQLEKMILISKLQEYKFTLEEIDKIINKASDEKDLYLELKAKEELLEGKIHDYESTLFRLKKDIVTLERGEGIMDYLDNLKVELVETKDKNIISIRKKINIKDYSKYMGELFKLIGENKLTPIGEPLTIYHSEEFDPENYDIEIAIPVKEIGDRTRTLKGQESAMISHKGSYKDMPSAYAKLREYIFDKNYELIAAPYEIYKTDPFKTKEDENITEIYFPIKKIRD